MNATLDEMIGALSEAALHPWQTVIKTMKETGKDAIGCFPIHTPEEIAYAADCVPIGMWGGRTRIRLADKYLQSFCCSIMRSNIEFAMNGVYDMLKAVIIPTFCDTLKCVSENWKTAIPHIPVITAVYPQNRNAAALSYLREEFLRIRGEIERILSIAISDDKLEEAFSVYEDCRNALRSFAKAASARPDAIDNRARHLILKAGYFMDKKPYTRLIRELTDELASVPERRFDGFRAVMTGLIGEPVEMADAFAENRIAIVADDIAHASRQFRTAARTEGDAIDRMVHRIADQKGDTFLYEDGKSKGEMLLDMVSEHGADAVVVCMMKFCDPEEFDYPIVKEALEKAGVPLLHIETDQQPDSYEQIRTRVQSFAEMLEARAVAGRRK
ncbi:MAG: 2-hydroxyacyl-CoA dehydratase family protein [Clostridiales Family XIII bacterium]|jgi:benzoyl-CoA reductase/2-hydroxyglutaryl-CoA dehydratase subunit BcrC/BadD/HgdB|nr:2-hydroxyacyl-CoA dehydratase family protein [Clostridiales Family XIII bacterium]